MSPMQPGSVVRIRNSSSRPWSDRFSNLLYEAPPGGEVIAPFEAACLWFGHPEAVDMGPGKTYRTDEYQRLRTKYGVLDVMVEDPDSGHNPRVSEPCCPFTQEQQWERNIPPVEVFDINGERIIMVTDDPSGAQVTPATQTVANQELLQEQLAAMQAQMQQLQAQLDTQTRGDTAEANSGPIPTDEPLVGPEGNTVGAKIGSIPDPSAPSGPSADPDAEVTEDTPTRVRVGSPR